MANIYTSADQLIGKTPLLELTQIEKSEGLEREDPCEAGIFQSGRIGKGPDREGDDR